MRYRLHSLRENTRVVEAVGDEILRQLKANPGEMMRWGPNGFLGLSDGLQFKASGPKAKTGGRILIHYDHGRDTYKVELWVIRGVNSKMTDSTSADVSELHRAISRLLGW